MVDYSNTFNTKQIVRNMIGRVVIPAFLEYAVDDVLAIQEPLDEAISVFFTTLADYMGTVEGLTALDIPGLRAWKPLSDDYRRRKHSDVFWLFTLSAGNSSAVHNLMARKMSTARRAKTRGASLIKLHAELTSGTLIAKFQTLNGLDAFGGVEITADNETERLAKTYFIDGMGLEERGASRETGRQAVDRNNRPITSKGNRAYLARVATSVDTESPDWEAVQANFSVRLWSTLSPSQISNIEETLMGQGLISQEDYDKLMNQRRNRRPLVRPYMAYYSQVLLPSIINEILNTHFNIGGLGFSDIATTEGPTKSGKLRGFYRSKLRAGVALKSSTKTPGELISDQLP